jgi:hypothetical protein
MMGFSAGARYWPIADIRCGAMTSRFPVQSDLA